MSLSTAEWRAYQRVSEKLRAAGVDIPADTLLWAVNEVRREMYRLATLRSELDTLGHAEQRGACGGLS